MVFDPISIAIALKVIALILVLAAITYQLILDWFLENEELVQSDMDNIAVTVKDLFETGNYALVQGIFNTRTEKVVAGRKIQAKRIDDKVEELHRDQILVVYN